MSVIEDLTALQPVLPNDQVFTGGVEAYRSTSNGHTRIAIKTWLALSILLENGFVAWNTSMSHVFNAPSKVECAISASQ